MTFKNLLISTGISLAIVLSFAIGSDTLAQGRGGGGGRPATAGPPSGSPGVDRGMGNSSTRSGGRSDDGLGNASTRSNGRSDSGIDRARLARENSRAMSDNELNRYRGISKRLGMTPTEMRARYEAALLANPDLKYGQFVAANVVADNLGGRFPAVTSSAILAGMANGYSLGQTLRDLGLSRDQSKTAEREAKDRIKSVKSKN